MSQRVGRLFSRVGEMVKGNRGDSEDSITKELIGFSAVKRKYAHKFDVDVYSSNEVLQKELNSVAWAGFAGGVGISLATRTVKGASELAYFSIKSTKLVHGMNQILLDNAPEDLSRLNREKLIQMGVEEPVIEEFLRNPNFSPRHETILVQALAEMIYGYHTQVGPISEIIPVRRVAVGYTSDQTIVIALPMDYIYWTERADLGLEAIMRLQAVERPVKRVELWVTGKISQKTRKEYW